MIEWFNDICEAVNDGQVNTPEDILSNFVRTFGEGYRFPFGNQKNNQGGFFAYPICISINDEIAHGNPRRNRKFITGDVVSIDAGLMTTEGLCIDCARSVMFDIGNTTFFNHGDYSRLIEATEIAAKKAFKLCTTQYTVNDLSKAIYLTGHDREFRVVKQLTGHGIGYTLHEDPAIPNVPDISKFGYTRLRPGMVICIEPMFTLEPIDYHYSDVVKDMDGWTLRTVSGQWAAHTEYQIAITEDYPILIAR